MSVGSDGLSCWSRVNERPPRRSRLPGLCWDERASVPGRAATFGQKCDGSILAKAFAARAALEV